MYRNLISTSYADEVTQRKERYTQEDKDLLQSFLFAKDHDWGLGSYSKVQTFRDGRSEEKIHQKDQTGNKKLHCTKVPQRGKITVL